MAINPKIPSNPLKGFDPKEQLNKAGKAALNKVFGGGAANSSPGEPSQGPWSQKKDDSSFFRPIEIDGNRWDKLFPYRLVVWDAAKGTIVSQGQNFSVKSDGSIYRIIFEPMGNSWVFRLPITPQQFSISTQYAISTTATQRGIVEEHNGVKFKLITLAGSMGVWPSRENLNSTPSQPTILSTLFSGTIEAFGGLTNQVNRTINSVTSNHPADLPTSKPPKGPYLESTGYYQTLLLDQFLEQYAEAKKKPENKSWRLVFDIPKENQSYIVTPMDFSYSRAADAPNENKYRLQLKAWRRINLGKNAASVGFPELTLTPDLLRKLITAVEEARRTIGSAYNLIKAVRSDFQTPFNLLREISLFAKDAAGLPAAVIDLPRQIISDAKSSIKDSIKNLDDAAIQLTSGTSKSLKDTLSTVKSSFTSREGISDSAVASGQLGLSAHVALETDPSIETFNTPEQNFDLFNLISENDVDFSFAQQERIDSDREIIQNTTVDDLIVKRGQLLELALQVSNIFGAGDQTFSDIYSRPDPYERIQDMTIDEFAILKSLYDTIQAIDSITATNEIDQGRVQNAFEYVGSLAAESEMTFQDSQSKVRLPVPFGLNMEQIAARYLGDPDRWLEIATLNGLRSPYIDEDGFFYSLLSNADGRQFNVPSNQNLFVGQKIVLSSLTQTPVTRRIINIEKISASNYLITVDGLDNLDVFTTTDQAKMRAYLPGTINSQDQIYVPSDLAVTDSVLSRPIPATKGDPLVGLSKVDWLMTDSGDIATDAFGDFRLAFGMANMIQALKLKFATPPNRLLKHPTYGAGLTPGISHADLNNQDVIKQILKSIEEDPRFGDIISLSITREGPSFGVALSVSLADGSGVFPISFVLNG
jgi:hypothetical protein